MNSIDENKKKQDLRRFKLVTQAFREAEERFIVERFGEPIDLMSEFLMIKMNDF